MSDFKNVSATREKVVDISGPHIIFVPLNPLQELAATISAAGSYD
jgi:hypothetical protein